MAGAWNHSTLRRNFLLIMLSAAVVAGESSATSKSSLSACTPASAVEIPITNVRLSNNQTARGIQIQVGQPAQSFAMVPEASYNGTWLYNTSAASTTCGTDDSLAKCITKRGGLLDTGSSRTFTLANDVDAAGGSLDPTSSGPYLRYGDDVVTFGGSTLSRYPIGMTSDGRFDDFTTQSVLGLGRNSTLLSGLKASGKIASKSFGYWWGHDGASPDDQKDGSLVLGGFDANKVMGQNITMSIRPPTPQCGSGLFLTISDIVLKFTNGTQASTTQSGSTLAACFGLDTSFMLMAPYESYYRGIERAANLPIRAYNSPGMNVGSTVYLGQNILPADLQFKLGNNGTFSIDVPRNLAVMPQRYIDESGQVLSRSNASEIPIVPMNSPSSTMYVGRYFFQAAYIFVNYDAGTWTLWQANSTSTESRLVAIGGDCPNNSTSPSINTSPAEGETPITTGSATSTPQSHSASHPLSKTILIAAAVGATVLAVAVAFLTVFLIRRRRQASSTPPPPYDIKAQFIDEKPSKLGGRTSVVELEDPVHEVHTVERRVELMAQHKPSYVAYGAARKSTRSIYELHSSP